MKKASQGKHLEPSPQSKYRMSFGPNLRLSVVEASYLMTLLRPRSDGQASEGYRPIGKRDESKIMLATHFSSHNMRGTAVREFK